MSLEQTGSVLVCPTKGFKHRLDSKYVEPGRTSSQQKEKKTEKQEIKMSQQWKERVWEKWEWHCQAQSVGQRWVLDFTQAEQKTLHSFWQAEMSKRTRVYWEEGYGKGEGGEEWGEETASVQTMAQFRHRSSNSGGKDREVTSSLQHKKAPGIDFHCLHALERVCSYFKNHHKALKYKFPQDVSVCSKSAGMENFKK